MFDTPLGRRAVLRRLSLALGGIATAPLASGLLGGCRTPEPGALPGYAYRTLSEEHQRTLAALVDQIIPATGTPGAAEAGVPQFIDAMLTDWYAPEERDRFLTGLLAVNDRAEGGAFTGLDPEAQAAFVAAMDAEVFSPEPAPPPETDDDVAETAQEGTAAVQDEVENEVAGMQGDLGEAQDSSEVGDLTTGEGTATVQSEDTLPFYRQLKELTVAGYYTSEIGATQELQWSAAPGRYESDVPLSEIGRAWA